MNDRDKVSFNQLVDENLFMDNSDNVFDVLEPKPLEAIEKIIKEEVKTNDTEYKKNDVYKNQTLINSGNDFDDGLDADDIKMGISKLLTNRKFLTIVAILIFISVCIVVTKAFYFGNKVDKIVEIEEKISKEAKAYETKELDIETLKKVAATELISCINSKVDMDSISDGVKNAINDINNYYNQSNNYFAFVYKDIYTGFTVSYNENQDIFSASTIKAPTDIYIYEMASKGKINLDDELTYTPRQYVEGSGSLQYKSFYTKYKVRDLLKYSTVYSDNIAHNILMDNYGRENMLSFWNDLGTTAIFRAKNNWGGNNAHDATIYMEELYRFYNEDNEYGNALMDNFLNATPKFIKGKNGYAVANKSGWTGSAIHDVSIIFADNPYIVVALSNTGMGDYSSYFRKANDLAYNLHTEYWKYKMSVCDSIKQY
jgi:beta-lactamase class A